MAQCGTLSGIIQSTIATGLTTISLADVDAKLKEIDKANAAVSKRWDQMMSSPQVASYRAKRSMDDDEQTQLIIDLENILGLVVGVCIAQQNVLAAMQGTMKQMNKK